MRNFATALLLTLLGLPAWACSMVSGPEITNPESVWEADAVVLARGNTGPGHRFVTLEVLKGENFPDTFDLPEITFEPVRLDDLKEGDFTYGGPTIDAGCSILLDFDAPYLLILNNWSVERKEYFIDYFSRSAINVDEGSPWLATVKEYIKAGEGRNHEEATQILELWLREAKEGTRHLPPGMEKDIQAHLETPTIHKSVTQLLPFLESEFPDQKSAAISSLAALKERGLTSLVLKHAANDQDWEVSDSLLEYLIVDGSPEAMPFLKEKMAKSRGPDGIYGTFSLLRAVAACAHPSQVEYVYSLMTMQDAEDVLFPWWEGKKYPPMLAEMNGRVKGDYLGYPEESLLIAGMGDHQVLNWAVSEIEKNGASSTSRNDKAELAARFLAVSPHERAQELMEQIIVSDGALMVPLAETLTCSRREDRFDWLKKVIASTKKRDVLWMLMDGGFNCGPWDSDPGWKEVTQIAEAAEENL